MNLKVFRLIDNEPIDNNFVKRDYFIIYHQQGALFNDPDQNVECIVGKILNYHQNGNSHLGFDITVRKGDGNNFNFTK